jgi:anthranilate synthase component 1
MFYPNFEEFKKLCEQGNLIPVYREILADLDTPVSAFLKLNGTKGFLFESVEGGEKWARYSFIGSNPIMTIESRNRTVIINKQGQKEERAFKHDPFEVVEEELSRYKPVILDGLPPFFGGLVGYIGYDVVRFFEDIGDSGRKGLDLADIYFMLTDTIVIFDNLTQKIKVVSNVVTDNCSARDAYDEAIERINTIVNKLKSQVKVPEKNKIPSGGSFTSNFSQEHFMEVVEKTRHYIRAGDVIQTVISQRFEKEVQVHPFNVYRTLRTINPSPYMFYLNIGEAVLVGSSPEILVRLEQDRIVLCPIAGTRKRGQTEEEDLKLEQELKADPKENAEHIMLVDLGRNDAGRVAVTGTVKVTDLMRIERYSHVMHITSQVEAELAKHHTMYDLLRASFPAGTLSGAPKIRAMEIIEELEPTRRGPYGGSVGYFSFSGNMDMCITIRTIIFKDNKAYIQAGAGIVADSVPENEYYETVNKARGMIKAIEMAERGLEG